MHSLQATRNVWYYQSVYSSGTVCCSYLYRFSQLPRTAPDRPKHRGDHLVACGLFVLCTLPFCRGWIPLIWPDNNVEIKFFVCFWRDSPLWASASSLSRFLDQTQRRTTVGRTPLDEWSVRRIYLYLTTHNTHTRQTSMSSVGFEPTIPAGERPQTNALDRTATGTVSGEGIVRM